MYKKILIANRSGIALRIIRALKEINIETVAIYSNADKDMPYVTLSDKSICIGSSNINDTYLNIYNIFAAATSTQCDAIHPGIGFWAKNMDFALICQEIGMNFIGSKPEMIKIMGNKNEAKKIARKCNIPVIPGGDSVISTIDDCYMKANEIGYPVLFKAARGGEGKGVQVVDNPEKISNLYNICTKGSSESFNKLILERYLIGTRHIGVQILADQYGNIIHLGDRECTIQHSKQKVIVEAPSMHIDNFLRTTLYHDALKIARYVGYIGVGTVEFLVLTNGDYYFLKMNTQLEIEHTITELITGIDLVKEQLKVCSGQRLTINQNDITFTGYALQCRIFAEYIDRPPRHSYGEIKEWHMPSGPGIRVDEGYKKGVVMTPYYDSLITLISAHSNSKQEAIRKIKLALQETQIIGIETNIELINFILDSRSFSDGYYDEQYVEQILEKFLDIKNNKG